MKERIEAFIKRVNGEIRERMEAFPEFTVEASMLTVSYGRKYAKLLSNNGGSAWGFVDLETGDILKAAGWNTPAKHPRGHISDAQYGRNYTKYGPNYLK